MKTIFFKVLQTTLLTLIITIFSDQLLAQNTNGIFFQAIAKDNFSNPAKDRKIYIQTSIIQASATGTKVLIEEHQAITDNTGIFSISIGNGTRLGGTASGLTLIDWSKGPYYLNIKIAITPVLSNDSWDYTKELIDMGTTSFGAVPFALYSASSAKVDEKLNINDTTKMLAVYAKVNAVKNLETEVASKFTAADIVTYTKKNYSDSAIGKKLNIADSSNYVTPAQFASKTFDQTPIIAAIALKANTSDVLINTTNIAANTASITSNTVNIISNTESITAITSDLALKITGSSPTFTGTPVAPTATIGTNTSQLATTAFVTTAVSSIPAASITGTVAVVNGGTGLNAAGTTGQVLTTTGSGTLTWTTASSISIGSIGASNANGASITSGVLKLAPADGTNSGIVTTGTQNFSGIKSYSSSMAIGTAAAPVSSAVLEVSSTTQGFLPPRMTAAQRDAIVLPEAGLVVWCTNCGSGEIEVYNGSAWSNFSGASAAAAVNIVIGTQTWNLKNLDVSTYQDGTPIPQVTNPNGSNWGSLTTGAWCYYNNDPANGAIYGKIYNWYAIAGIFNAASLADPTLRKQIAPTGYHVPTKNEYITLTTFLSGDAGKMKESGSTHWVNPNTGATNSSGFTALPTGELQYDGSAFYWLGNYGYLWSSTLGAPQGNPTSWCIRLDFNNTNITLGEFYTSTGLYVRCIKD